MWLRFFVCLEPFFRECRFSFDVSFVVLRTAVYDGRRLYFHLFRIEFYESCQCLLAYKAEIWNVVCTHSAILKSSENSFRLIPAAFY